jgi:hypothetical protein
MLNLVAKRLKEDPKQAASDMAAMLHLVELDERNPVRDRWGQLRTKYRRDVKHTEQIFRLLCQLADLGEAACEKSEAVRVGAHLLRIIEAEGIPSYAIANAVAQAAASLDSDGFDSAVDSLLKAWGPKQLGTCFDLVAASQASEPRQKRFLTALMTALGLHGQGGQLPEFYEVPEILTLANALLEGVEGEQCDGMDVQLPLNWSLHTFQSGV